MAERVQVPAKRDREQALLERIKSPAITTALTEVATRHLTADKLQRIAVACWKQNPKLQECDPQSFLLSVLEAAKYGLDPSGGALGQAYLVPHYNKKKRVSECTLIIGYRGLISLVRRAGEVATLTAECVYEKDFFEYELGLDEKLKHIPSTDEDRGRITRVYAIARFKDGMSYQFTVMSVGEVNRIMRNTQSKGEWGPWRDHYPEMAKKTAVRRLVKMLPIATEGGEDLNSALTSEDRRVMPSAGSSLLAPGHPADKVMDVEPIEVDAEPSGNGLVTLHAKLNGYRSNRRAAWDAVVGRRRIPSIKLDEGNDLIVQMEEWLMKQAEMPPGGDGPPDDAPLGDDDAPHF